MLQIKIWYKEIKNGIKYYFRKTKTDFKQVLV